MRIIFEMIFLVIAIIAIFSIGSSYGKYKAFSEVKNNLDLYYQSAKIINSCADTIVKLKPILSEKDMYEVNNVYIHKILKSMDSLILNDLSILENTEEKGND